MSVASSSDLSCGLHRVYHISWLFSMWLWLISDPRCCLVHKPEAGSRGVSVTYVSPHYLCYNYTLIHAMAPKYPTSAPSVHAGCVMLCRSKEVNRVTHLIRDVSCSVTAQVWTISLYLYHSFIFFFFLPQLKETSSAEVWFPSVTGG